MTEIATEVVPPKFKLVATCEACGKAPATSFSYFGAPDEDRGEWKFCCSCTTNNEEYYVCLDRFFRSPSGTVDWLAHLSEKSWVDWSDFMAMMCRFRKATGSFWQT